MDCIKTENDALIFVNKELGRMNDELTTEIQSRSWRSSENEASDQLKKKIKSLKPLMKSKKTMKKRQGFVNMRIIYYVIMIFI